MDGERGEIWCYSDRFSYRPGETVALHVSSTASSFGIAIVRDGGTETKVFEKAGIASRWQDTPDQCSVEGCGWEASFEFRVGDDWPSGAYRMTLTADGRDGKPIHCHHLFIVAPLPGQQTRPRAAGGGDGHLARLQHLGRLQPLRGHHRRRSATSIRPSCRRSAHGVVASSCCRRRRRACRWKSPCRPRPCRATRIWNGPSPPAIRRNTPRPAGRATTATSFALPSVPATPSISPASTICIFRLKSSTATIVSSSSAMTNTGPGRCATPSTPMSSAAVMRPASPAISCGRHGWRTRAAVRSATNIAPAPKTLPIAAAT